MDRSGQGRMANFRLMYLVTQLIGVVLLILMFSWVFLHLDGLGYNYDKPSVIFNWHPVCMVFGMVFLYGNSILIYRGFRFGRKRNLKITHATIHGLAFLFAVFGLVAVFDSHNYAVPPIPNLYSLHSWIGLLAIILFGLQYAVGFFCFLIPQVKESIKIFYMPLHIFFGLLGYVFALAAALMGLSEKAFFVMHDYAQLPTQALLVNFIGILLACFGSLVMYLVTAPEYKREPLPEDTLLLTGNQAE